MIRLEPLLIRIPPEIADALRALARRTRIRKSDLEREAIADLLRKYDALPAPPPARDQWPDR